MGSGLVTFTSKQQLPVCLWGSTNAGPYKPRTGRTGQCMCHAPAILAAPAVYCIHGHIIDQARNRQTVENVSEKHVPSLSAATANTHRPSNCSNF